MGIGLALIGAGAAVVAVAASSSNEMDQVLGAYVGGWIAALGGLELLRRSQLARQEQGTSRPSRPARRPAGGGAA